MADENWTITSEEDLKNKPNECKSLALTVSFC